MKNLNKEKATSYIFYGSNELLTYEAVRELSIESGISTFDTLEVEPEKKDKNSKEEINVKAIRELIRQINLTPAHGSGKLAIIKGADKLNIEAANTLLKTLEEPPKSATIILLSSNLHLLPTILSRCQIIRFDDTLTEADEEVLTDFRQAIVGGIKELFVSAEKMSVENGLEERLNVIIASLRKQLFDDPNPKKIRIIKLIFEAKRKLKITTNKRLVLENLLLNIKYPNN